MVRTDDDTWGLASSVGAMAMTVAVAARAVASRAGIRYVWDVLGGDR